MKHDAHFKNSTGRLFTKRHEMGFSGARYLAQESGVNYDTVRRLAFLPHYQQSISFGVADAILSAMEMVYLVAGDDPEIPILPNPRYNPPRDEKERLARERKSEREKQRRSQPAVHAQILKRRRARARKVRLDSAQAV